MIRTALLACLVAAATTNSYSQIPTFPKLTGPYLGQTLPGMTPEIFAPGIISSEDYRELGGGCFSLDGKEYYFTRDVNGRWRIMVSQLKNSAWTTPAQVEFTGDDMALEPHLTLDNQRIFWVSQREKNSGTCMAERTNNGWSKAYYVGQEEAASSSKDGEMYVTDRSQGPNQIVGVQIHNRHFVHNSKLNGEIEQFQKENRTAHPSVSPDGRYLLFDINGTHMFVSFRGKDGTWKHPIDLTQHGLSPDAGIASISPDGNYLFFNIEGDIYRVSAKFIDELRPKELR